MYMYMRVLTINSSSFYRCEYLHHTTVHVLVDEDAADEEKGVDVGALEGVV